MSARWRLYFPRIQIRLGVAALLAFAVQFVVTDLRGISQDLREFILVGSYLLALVFIAANITRPGIVLIGAGLLLNFAAILANGGLMPTTPATMADAGYDLPAHVGPGDWIPKTKDVLLAREDVNLWFLGDRLVVQDLPRFRAFSIGDVVIAAGLFVTLCDLLLPRPQRRT